MMSNFAALARDYDLNTNKLKMGLVEAELLIEQKAMLDNMEEEMADLIFEINLKIVELDTMTNGAYSRLLKIDKSAKPNLKASPFLRPSADELMAEIDKEEASNEIGGSWTLAPVAEGMTQSLTIQPTGSKAAEVAFYQVFNSDGVVVSEKIAVAEGFIHLSLTFSDKTNLVVHLLNANDELLYKTSLDGYGEFGALAFYK